MQNEFIPLKNYTREFTINFFFPASKSISTRRAPANQLDGPRNRHPHTLHTQPLKRLPLHSRTHPSSLDARARDRKRGFAEK